MTNALYSSEYQNVIKRLKEARIQLGMKQDEVARALDRPQSFVSKIERGERRIDIVEIKLFAQLYKKSVGFFVD